MTEKLEIKIEEVLNYIVSKPVEQITGEDFTILAGELKERRFREQNEQQRVKSAELLRQFMDVSNLNNAHV